MQEEKATAKTASAETDTAKESELIRKIRAGDLSAAAQFIGNYQPQVREVITHIIREPALVTAATRAAFKTAILRLQRGRQTGPVCPWLMQIARAEALAQLRVWHALDAKAEQSESRNPELTSFRSDGNGCEQAEKSKRQPARRSAVWSTVFLSALCAALAWCALGILAKNEILSLPDLGYGWFNMHLFPLF